MRFYGSALCAAVALALLAGCSANSPATGTVPSTGAAVPTGAHGRFVPVWSENATLVPDALRPVVPMPLHGNPAPLHGNPGPNFAVAGGVYVSEFYSTDLYGYVRQNKTNDPPSCTLSGVVFPNDIASDDRGNIIVPDGGSRSVNVYKGSGQCGSLIGSFHDRSGQPSDATSMNAEKGEIAVAHIYSSKGFGHRGGTVTVCTIAGSCATPLVNANMYEVAGVAMSRSGDCWVTALNGSGTPTMTYFQGCQGAGVTATGFRNANVGGLDIDNQGNIVSISSYDAKVYVYSGCNPACKLVSGPFNLNGEAIFGHLNRQAMALATADFQYGQVDVYMYTPKKIKYLYSFNNGLSATDVVEGVAFSQRSHE
jgi:hypothetical protein